MEQALTLPTMNWTHVCAICDDHNIWITGPAIFWVYLYENGPRPFGEPKWPLEMWTTNIQDYDSARAHFSGLDYFQDTKYHYTTTVSNAILDFVCVYWDTTHIIQLSLISLHVPQILNLFSGVEYSVARVPNVPKLVVYRPLPSLDYFYRHEIPHQEWYCENNVAVSESARRITLRRFLRKCQCIRGKN